MKDKISVVIPTLNEAENLSLILHDLQEYADEIIVVDGYSKDNTTAIANEFGCKVFYDNYGKGSAITAGVKESSGDFVITIDADMSHRPMEIKSMLEGLARGYDICMGSRFMEGGGSSDITFVRTIGNKFFVLLVNLLFGGNYTDLCYGYRSFRKSAFDKLDVRSKGFSIETEISIKAAKKKMKVLEVPSFEKARNKGNGKLRTFSDGWKILKVIIKEVLNK
ncbi:MAG: glycosyltransferase family 2 protein [Nanoarchaeota archaeon]|nr:glycosyltransferase family 2 protein [Nanoarchaeota archaeon]